MSEAERIAELRAVLASIAGTRSAEDMKPEELRARLDRCQRAAEQALLDDDKNKATP